MTRPNRPKFRSLYLWHRYTGLALAIVIVVLAITGLLLQHAHPLGLDRLHLSNRWLLSRYGIQADPVTSYKTGSQWLSQAGEQLYLSDRPTGETCAELTGAAEIGQGIAATCAGELVLLSPQGQPLDRLHAGSLPEPARGLAPHRNNRLILRGQRHYWLSDPALLDWRPYQGPHPVWTVPGEAPLPLRKAIQRHNITHRITWERLLMDLHSGRLFGTAGIVIVDLTGVGLLWLAVTGIWTWLQRRRKNKSHHGRK